MAVDFDNSAVGEYDEAPTAYDDRTVDRSPYESGPATVSPAANAAEGVPPASAAVQRFRSCRWRKPPEDGEAECCTHRDVLPLTGARGFDPEAWCTDCALFKLRRTPRKPNH